MRKNGKTAWWILGGLVVVGGGAAYWYYRKQDSDQLVAGEMDIEAGARYRVVGALTKGPTPLQPQLVVAIKEYLSKIFNPAEVAALTFSKDDSFQLIAATSRSFPRFHEFEYTGTFAGVNNNVQKYVTQLLRVNS